MKPRECRDTEFPLHNPFPAELCSLGGRTWLFCVSPLTQLHVTCLILLLRCSRLCLASVYQAGGRRVLQAWLIPFLCLAEAEPISFIPFSCSLPG